MKRTVELDYDAVDLVVQLGVAGGEALESLAGEVRSRPVRVLNRVEEGNK
ncbi:MAG: hypothetical protein R6U63_03690 [Longimicrobiales bacterium]